MKKNYFDVKKRLHPHGVMFHRFHNDGDKYQARGSLTTCDLENILEYIGLENILPADKWLEKAVNDKLSARDICLTFDDSLKCQIEIAYPVLNKFGITAFWFIYSSVFMGSINRLEIYNYFYNTYFTNFDSFYEIFKKYLLDSRYRKLYGKYYNQFIKEKYLIEFDFYSEREREFRFYRDKVLKKEEFEVLMDKILNDYGVDSYRISRNLWMNNKDLLQLSSCKHIVGLHSFSHPTNINQLDTNNQRNEYMKNKSHILSITNDEPTTVAYPCGLYDGSTLEILREMGIKIGFRSNFHKLNQSIMEYPRIDSTHILSELNQ